MAVQDFFGPSVWGIDDIADKDLGSNGPLLIPRAGSPLVFATGKQNTGFLLDSAALSSTPTHIGGELFSANVCDQESFGANAYSAPYLYVPCQEGLRALAVNTSSTPPTFTRAWQGPADATGPPIVAGGRVWVHGSNNLYGLNAATGAVEVNRAVSTPYNFGSASAAGGSLFYPAGTSVVAFRPSASNYLAAIGIDNSVWDKRDPGAWTPLAGASTAAPAVVSLPNENNSGSAVFIATGTDRDLYVRSEATGWQKLNFNGSVVCIDNPAAVIANGTLSVACMGADNTLWAGSATVSGVQLPKVDRTSWRNLGGVLIAGPAVASVNGTITYFAEGTDHHVYTRTPTLGYAPTPWFCIGHPAGATLGTSSHFACQGLDTQLWYSMNSGSGWGDAQQLGGILVDGPGIAAGPAGATMYVEGLDGTVWHRTASTSWTNNGGIVHNGVGASYIP